MIRWYIIRTLLYKEMLRYCYNWGLLVVVLALLALSGLVALGSRFKQLPGQTVAEVNTCIIYYRDEANSRRWLEYLRVHQPAKLPDVRLVMVGAAELVRPSLKTGQMGIELIAPHAARTSGASPSGDGWKIVYWYGDEEPPGMMEIRDWCVRETQAFLGTRPRLIEQTAKGTAPAGSETLEKLPQIVAALAIFAMYLLSFNLFITSTGEEREKRLLLGLLLTPVRPGEMLLAKILFYASASLVVCLAVVGMYDPLLLLRPLLWATIVCGSVGYIAVGTVIISIVRRQTTINTISMLYLLATSIIMMLSEFLVPFQVLHLFLIENYLYSQMRFLVAGQQTIWMPLNMVLLAVLALAWCAVARLIFSRQATSIAQGR